MMECKHLQSLEAGLLAAGIKETFRGQAWSNNCREWVYFDCLLDLKALRRNYNLPEFVISHVNNDPRSGLEAGFVCQECKDGIIGLHTSISKRKPVFNGNGRQH